MNENETTVLAEDEHYRVEMQESSSVLYVLWKRHLEGEQLQERYLTLLSLIRHFKPRTWLGNATAMRYTTLQDAKWVFSTFLPILFNSSIAKYARVELSQSLLTLDSQHLKERLNTRNQRLEKAFEFGCFTDEEQARTWLASGK